MMKTTVLLAFLILAGCSRNDTLVDVIPSPTPTPTPGGVKFPLAPYQDSLDTLYFKVWSDSSWMAYGGTKVIGTTTYFVVKDNAGNEYYYDSAGYAGFYNPGSTVIIFDTPLGAWPDSLQIYGQISESTTFPYQGYSWTMSNTYRLADTSAASAAFGTFDPSLHFQYVSSLVAAGSGSTSSADLWLANGPGQIVQEDMYGNVFIMARGHVNGRYWGVGFAKPSPARTLSRTRPEELLNALSAGVRMKFRFRGAR